MDDEEIQKEFLFPQNDIRLEKFVKLTTEQQLNSIYIGTIIQEIGEDKYIRLKDGENELEKDNLKQMYENELIYLKKQMQLNKKKFSEEKFELMDEIKITKNTIREKLKEEYDQKYLNTIDSLEDKLLQLQSKAEELRDNRLKRELEHHKNILEEKKITEEKLNNQRENYETKLTEYRNKIESLICITDTSTKKGQEGEDWTFNELLRLFPKAQIEDTHSIKHRGDFIIKDDYIGMVDSKKFKSNVPKRDIDKFKSDMETNSDFQYGILCATDNGIATKSDLSLEFVSGKPIVYVCKACKNPQKILIACNLCKLILKNMNCFDITKEENQLVIKEKTKSIIKYKKKMIKKITDFSEGILELMESQWGEFESVLKQINVKN